MKDNRIVFGSRAIVLVIALIMVVPVGAVLSTRLNADSGKSLETETVRIFIDSAQIKDLREIGVKIIEGYESFVLAEVTSEQRAFLEQHGVVVNTEKHLTKIGINGFVFDTKIGVSKIPSNLRIESYPEGAKGYYLVQFHGPVKEEWKIRLTNLGAEILKYFPYNTFMVKMDQQTKIEIENLNFVQWIDIFHPAYKIRPGLEEMSGQVMVEILTFKGAPFGGILRYLKKAGGNVLRYKDTGDFGIITAIIDTSMIPTLANMDAISYIEPKYEMKIHNERMQWIMQTNEMDVRYIWDKGLTGSGQIIAIADTGIDYDHNMFRDGSGNPPPSSTHRKVIAYQPMAALFDEMDEDPDEDGKLEATNDSAYRNDFWYMTSGHGTLCSSVAAGEDSYLSQGTSLRDGAAKDAKIFFQDIGSVKRNKDDVTMRWDDYLKWIPDDYYDLFWPAYENGSRIHSDSWGARNADYDAEAMMIDRFIWEHPDMTIISSVGNGGPTGSPEHDCGSPATAKSCISAGSTDTANNQDNVASYSSRGPCEDGRRKPTIMAVGTGISAKSDGNNLDKQNTADEQSWQGTSYASPDLAGHVALIRQYFLEGYYPTGSAHSGNAITPSSALVKALLCVGAEQMTGSFTDSKNEDTYPNNSQGWGRALLNNTLFFNDASEKKKLSVVDNVSLLTGDVSEYSYYVTAGTELRVILAWSDYPGEVAAIPATVNDLDLYVEDESGNYYKGNVMGTFAQGESIQNPADPHDNLNVLEGVLIKAPSTGKYTVRITGANVPAGPQPFAFAVLGDLDLSYGSIQIDKCLYGDADTIEIEVQDVGASSVTVKVNSTTETTPENVVLMETESGSGIWKGTIKTEFLLPSSANGNLSVSKGDTIYVSYHDASPDCYANTTASVDVEKPVISNIFVEDVVNTAAVITWTTDENSDSTVYWGNTTDLLGTPVSDLTLKTYHSVVVKGLEANTLYYFDVESTDWFGHSARDDFAGSHYTFKTVGDPVVLLIDDDRDGDMGGGTRDWEDQHKASLEGKGWSYVTWNTIAFGTPSLSYLQSAKVVAWFTGDGYPTADQEERDVIEQYLLTDKGDGTGAGRLFMSSQDLAWQLSDPLSDEMTQETKDWLEKYMKAIWMGDDADGMEGSGNNFTFHGITGDPISDQWEAVNIKLQDVFGEPEDERYWPDDITNNGGTIAWDYESHAYGGNAAGIRYVGTYSGGEADARLVFEAFSHEMINGYTNTKGYEETRASILDKSLKWLMGNDPPTVTVLDNNGQAEDGTWSGIEDITWSASDPNAQTLTCDIDYSPDSGQTWYNIIAGTNNDYVHSWDTTGVPNGNKYLIRITVTDTPGAGTPILSNVDVSDAVFTIDNGATYDTQAPVTTAGSVIVDRQPVEAGQLVNLTAIIDDSDKGNLTISDAEWCHDDELPYEPTWPGTSMQASDGSFDEPKEDVKAQIDTTGWKDGIHRIFVRGKDAKGASDNWNPGNQSVDLRVFGGGEVCFNISLVAGLNLISMPLNASGLFDAQDLIDLINADGGGAVSVSRWLAATGVWDTFNDGGASPFTIEVWEGYFINCNKASTWNARGKLQESKPVDLVAGLTLTGISKDMGGSYDAQDLINDINADGGSAQAVSRWLAATGVWDTFNDGGASPFIIDRGAGYFVNNAMASTWTP